MVAKMMRWRPWPPLPTRKYEVRLVVRRLEGCDPLPEGRLAVEVRWKGPKVALMSSLRRTAVKRNFTREEGLGGDGFVVWDEEFESLCALSACKENVFHPWEIAFTVFNGLDQGTKSKVPVIGTASVNLAEYASVEVQKEFELSIPLTIQNSSSDTPPLLSLSLSLVELRTSQETVDPEQRSIVPIRDSSSSGEPVAAEKDELSTLKAGLRRVKIFTEYVSVRKAKKPCCEEDSSEGRYSGKSEDGEYSYPYDTESPDDSEEGESEDGKESSSVRKSFSYGTLAYVNHAGGSFCSNRRIDGEDEDWVYYSYRRSDTGSSLQNEDPVASASQLAHLNGSKRGILSWRKRKLNFRSPKARGEPLLKKAYAEEGGDDIDFDRRQLSSDESLAFGWHKMDEDSSAHRSSVSEFGEDNFAIGCWEQKEVISRDGQMKLQTPVFFASIDQRSERAAGESACTALVAVIADWFQSNRDLMPIKSQFDSLIRDGSLEWRNLCENETYRERFPDKHFDLETVLQAKIRPLAVVPGKSFIGFFHPDGMDEEGFDFLRGAMSFDEIWDEISRSGSECPSNVEPRIYIVSWNDHFFVLKVESEAYYIIDTLGERLYEGCNQAYILKFDENTTISKMPKVEKSSEEKTSSSGEPNSQQQQENASPREESAGDVLSEESKEEEVEIVCRGKESCREYIKSFLAAIPIGELQADMKKGLTMASAPLHHRLQIEFHYTGITQQLAVTPIVETESKEDIIEAAAVEEEATIGIMQQLEVTPMVGTEGKEEIIKAAAAEEET
ncbi:uncharacterized protein LOC116208321 [Punica granatum]|uniref:Uncharacterized protein LOC116208321 n=1 Tax=Punica granatum TaxID=22663 RepID=A0A218XCZ8_PUNGR|nr:uncharacterized protein LOC116208321 [Punica granatum]OWM82600.1 hypothetical protein CDL15_Pgr002175 [Punica granatum]